MTTAVPGDRDTIGPLPLPDDLMDALTAAGGRLGIFEGRLSFFERLDSTNDVAARLASFGAAEGTTIVAEMQTAGRGRLGRVWYSPAGAGLYVSTVFRPLAQLSGEATVIGASRYTLMAGVAVADAIRSSTGLPVEIKWPNDVIIAGGRRPRKVAGILTEASALGDTFEYVVVGFGINLRQAAYPSALVRSATSLEVELGRPVDRAAVLVEVLAALAERAVQTGPETWHRTVARWRALAPSSRGAAVRWRDGGGERIGTTEGIDDSGALRVRVNGKLERVIAGEVSWL